ncbi:MAG: LarC family nickel insertion protein, partial [Armatimonadetes bacterium]|nr:LarC family nickel insertion protein [Armatimonadota bacterium]
MKIAYFDCFSGISGDMALGALVDAGANFEELTKELQKLSVSGYYIESRKTVKGGISATDVTVTLQTGPEPARRLAQITGLIESSGLSENVKGRAVAIFRRLAEAEAKIHGKGIDDVHFHEVGAVDAIVDIVGVCICLDLLGIE